MVIKYNSRTLHSDCAKDPPAIPRYAPVNASQLLFLLLWLPSSARAQVGLHFLLDLRDHLLLNDVSLTRRIDLYFLRVSPDLPDVTLKEVPDHPLQGPRISEHPKQKP